MIAVPVWDQIVTAFSTLNRLSRNRPERPALQRYISARLHPVLDRLGWEIDGSGDDDSALLRASLIRALGELGDEVVIAEAKAAVRRIRPRSHIAAAGAARSRRPCRRDRGGSRDI